MAIIYALRSAVSEEAGNLSGESREQAEKFGKQLAITEKTRIKACLIVSSEFPACIETARSIGFGAGIDTKRIVNSRYLGNPENLRGEARRARDMVKRYKGIVLLVVIVAEKEAIHELSRAFGYDGPRANLKNLQFIRFNPDVKQDQERSDSSGGFDLSWFTQFGS